MTDYWKSTPKYFCKYCNCWLTDSKEALFRHENGRQHKEKMALHFKSKKDEKEQEHRQKNETVAAMKAIEAAAKAAYSRDVAGFGFAGGAGAAAGAATATADTAAGRAAAIFISDADKEALRLASLTAPPPPPLPSALARRPPPPPAPLPGAAGGGGAEDVDPFPGQYVVDGKVYVEGEAVERKLARGMACELWLDAADDWVPAVVSAVVEVAVPHTDHTLRQYTVKYEAAVVEGEGEGESEGAQQQSPRTKAAVTVVRADALRVVPALPPPVEERDAQRAAATQAAAAAAAAAHVPDVVRDEHTGYSKWSTVTLSVAETQARDTQRDAAGTSMFKSMTAKQQGSAKRRQQPRNQLPIGAQEEEGTMDSYAQYNPHGGAYRGVEVKGETATLGELRDNDSGGAGGGVAFKKRKGKDKKKKKPKMMRRATSMDDD